MYNVLICDQISEKGIDLLNKNKNINLDVNLGLNEQEIIKIITKYHGVIVRSQTKITSKIIDAGTKLKVIGRAGVGVDNIDTIHASEKGIIVMNTPGGNTISTAEHALALMLALARKITSAHNSMKTGKWERKKFIGTELNNKNLTVIGSGRVGSELIKRAHSFNMKISVYDPFISQKRAEILRVDLKPNLEEAIKDADFITLHMPSTDKTKYIINKKILSKAKDGIHIINCARGDLINQNDLLEAIKNKKVASAAIDVYEIEPLPKNHPFINADNLILTPHLGASTSEAQENVGLEIADTIANALIHNSITNSVNMPNIDSETSQQIKPYMEFAETLGRIASQIAKSQCDHLKVTYSGRLTNLETSLITRSVLVGYLSNIKSSGSINFINVPSVAKQCGLITSESLLPNSQDYTETIEIDTWRSKNKENTLNKISGAYFGKKPRIVRLNDKYVEVRPEGYLLLVENTDVPGIIGKIGTYMGDNKINIANMFLSRDENGGTALAILNLDDIPNDKILTGIEKINGVISAKVITL